jgi:peroxiredoxin
MAPPELPEGFISASDSLLLWTRPNPDAWDHTRSLLVRLFDQHGPDYVSQYLVDRYVVGPDALVPADRRLLAILADQLKVSVGARAPEVMLPDPIAQDTILLYDLLGRNRLVALFFYSSTCDHCHDQMPHLDDIHEEWKEHGFELVGIALDPDLKEFQYTIEEKRFEWPVFSELMGWGSPAAKAFQVKATPTFFLLDGNGIIVAKPYDHQELRQELVRFFN